LGLKNINSHFEKVKKIHFQVKKIYFQDFCVKKYEVTITQSYFPKALEESTQSTQNASTHSFG